MHCTITAHLKNKVNKCLVQKKIYIKQKRELINKNFDRKE